MTKISDEIKILQLRIIELEKKQLEIQEINKTSVNYNLDIINNVLIQKKKDILCTSRHPEANKRRCHDKLLISYLEPILNILKNIDERITKLEKN